jgi:non-ribosomal peptide synthetase component F
VANRNRAELEDLIGFFVNQLVLRGRLEGDPSFAELVDAARATTLEAYNHQDFPFNKLVEELNPVRANYPPVFQAKLVLQNNPQKDYRLPGVAMEPMRWDRGTAQLDLLLVVTEREGGLDCAFEFNTDLFLSSTIERLQKHLALILETVVAGAEVRLETLFEVIARQNARLEKEQRSSFRKMSSARFQKSFKPAKK